MYYIICRIDVDGFHFWKSAPDQLDFLRNKHRHVFVITAKIPVTHDDRQLEIIQTQHNIQNYLYKKYGNPCQFQNMSCEQIAFELANEFNAKAVTVLEDGFGGATYERS